MGDNNKMKLWEDLSSEEKVYYRNENDDLEKQHVLECFLALYPDAQNIQEVPGEIKKRQVQLSNTDFSALKQIREEIREKQVKEYYYSNWGKTAKEVFYSSHFDYVVSETHFDNEIRLLLIKGEIKMGQDKQKLIGYIEEKIKDKELTILEEYTWGVDWYGLEMPGINKKDVLYQWFDLNHIRNFDSFIRDLVMIKELKDCIDELSYPISEKSMYNGYYFINQRKNEKGIEDIKAQITEWIFKCFTSHVEEMDIVYFKLALFRFLDEEKDVEVKEIRVIKQDLKSADLNSFIWVVWHYWNSIKAIKQETLVVFVKKFFKNIYKDYQEKGHPVIQNETIISHLKEDVGSKIKIPKTLKKTNKTK